MINAITQADIADGLRRLGLRRGDAVEVHSSLGSLGYVEGGAPAVIRALIDVVGEDGAIVMSAYTVTPPLPLTDEEKALGLLAKVRFLDEDSDARTGMGVIADTFRQWPGACLGTGLHRVCAWGRDAHLHSQGYGYLLSIDGWVLLLGVDINRCSSMHQAEGKTPLPQGIVEHFRVPQAILDQYPESDWYVQYSEPGQPLPDDAWGKVIAEARRRGLVTQGSIGQAECLFFKARPVVGLYEEFLRTDPFSLFGVSPEK